MWAEVGGVPNPALVAALPTVQGIESAQSPYLIVLLGMQNPKINMVNEPRVEAETVDMVCLGVLLF